jgi:hypothetical protein
MEFHVDDVAISLKRSTARKMIDGHPLPSSVIPAQAGMTGGRTL